jgi:hypothetical protein
MSYFHISHYIGDVVIGELQDCTQLELDQELPPHPTHFDPLYI